MTWKESLFFEAVYRHTWQAIKEDGNKGTDCKASAYDALEAIRRTAGSYIGEEVLFWLPLRILYKKCRMIEQATTKAALKEIAKPSVPKESCGKFLEGPYHVPEEEMLLWSLASLQAPLGEYGYKRYMELFSRFFPMEAEEILGTVPR